MTTEDARQSRLTILLAAIVISGCSQSDKVAERIDAVGESASSDLTDFSNRPETASHLEEPPKSEPVADESDTTASSKLNVTPDTTRTREPIYDPESDADVLISAAVAAAHRDNKHVLIEWGGNWCGWCYKLHDVFTEDEDVKSLVYENFELVLIDSRTNQQLMHRYGGSDRQYSFPHLTALDADGNVLVNQNTEPLEAGSAHDPTLVADFLRRWVPDPLDARARLNAALQRAGAEDKHVLVHVDTPYCGWCKVLSRFLADHEVLFDQDFIDLKIDTLRMTDGKEVADELRPTGARGVPWMVVIDSSGEVKATSIGPDGNCGYPPFRVRNRPLYRHADTNTQAAHG